jgi:hypothetical protein
MSIYPRRRRPKPNQRSYHLSIEKRLVLLCSAALLAIPAMAQNAPILRPGVWEVGGFVGASYGIDQTRAMGGGNVVYSLTQTFMPFAEVSYFPGIGRSATILGISSSTQTYSVPLTDFNAGFHLRIPIPKSRIIPYGVISGGAIHTPSTTFNYTYPNPVNANQTVTGSLPVGSATNFAISFGGGIRYYATERLGFRVEAKGYKAVDVGTVSTNPIFYRVAFGFFYQF